MTNSIRILPPEVADKIAAGEVIERPSSVVKELVENALDAGATEIAVHLEGGGKDGIEVLDNGFGMGRQDLEKCVLRHATSKLSQLADLESLRTLGFRGEALPSIAAVSDFSIITRAKSDSSSSTAHELKAADGRAPSISAITFGHFLASPHGTCVRARSLFAQIPARLKFLRSQGAEVSNVREWLERLSLTHPSVGFRLVSDDRPLLNLRPDTEVGRAKTLLADGDEGFPLQTMEETRHPLQGGSLRLRLHWIQGLSLPQSRKLIQIVNRRAVRDRVLQQAMLSPFRQSLMPGQFPALALFIEIDPSHIDVNVHPSKTEIRFLESRKVFQAVEALGAKLISERGAPVFAPSAFRFGPWETPGFQAQPSTEVGEGAFSHYESRPLWPSSERPMAPSQREGEFTVFATPSTTAAPLDTSPQHFLFFPENFTGILFNTYLLYSSAGELGLIDQHAAHERVRFEKLKGRSLNPALAPAPQGLLIPEAVSFPEEARATVVKILPALKSLGFEAELFGESSLLFRAVPSEWGMESLAIRLKNGVEKLIHESETNPDFATAHSKNGGQSDLLLDESFFELLASEACHSSVRAGDPLKPAEAFALTEALFKCAHPWNCPHGRPTVVRVPAARLEEWFRRRV